MSEDYDPLSFMPDPSQLKSGFRCSERRLYVKFQLQWFPNNHIISYIRNTMEDLSLFNDIEGLMLTMSEIDFILILCVYPSVYYCNVFKAEL